MSDCPSVLLRPHLRVVSHRPIRCAEWPGSVRTMTKEPTLEEQELLADTRRRATAAKPRGELVVELSSTPASRCRRRDVPAAVSAGIEPLGGDPVSGRDVRGDPGGVRDAVWLHCGQPARLRPDAVLAATGVCPGGCARWCWPLSCCPTCSPGERPRCGCSVASPTPGSPSARRSCSRSPASAPDAAGPRSWSARWPRSSPPTSSPSAAYSVIGRATHPLPAARERGST